MTDGIIQKIINKYRLKPTWDYDELQQELIEEIKQSKKVHGNFTGKADILFVEDLIGDI